MADRIFPPILLYGVVIHAAIESGDRDVMKATAVVSKFMMDRVGKEDSEEISAWYQAHEELVAALG